MQKQQTLALFALLAVTAAVACGARPWLTERADALAAKAAYEELLANTPVAELEGETVSLDGRLEVLTTGKSDLYVSGVVVPETIQIVDRKTGEVKWEDKGYLWQSVSWSPGNDLVALAYGGRTWTAVKVISTDYWTRWDFTLPDGSPIPEYTFLPEDWGTWLAAETLLLTVGRGGDGEEQHTYTCALVMDQGRLTGASREMVREPLPGTYDFDQNGAPETVERWTYEYPSGGRAELYELRIWDTAGNLCWKEEAEVSHAGGNAVYALKVDEQDYLLRYVPFMGQGYCTYFYQLFSLEETMQPAVLREDRVEFDINWGSPYHSFDTEAVAAFL